MRLLTRAGRIALALLLPGALLSSVPRPTAGSVEAGSVNPGTTLARDLCLTVALGDAAAAECGDLRLAHALPSARTLDRARTPVLLYNSQHARPYPLVAAHVTLGWGTVNLRRVEATLYVNGAPRAQRTYPGDQWPDEGAARVVLGYGHDSREGSNWHAYRLRIVARYGASGAPEESADTLSATGELVVVNRASSPFGAGWWLAGYERLRLDGQGRPALWIGGDGSTRRYARVDSTRWVAPSLDRPDTLVLDPAENVFARLLPGGVRVLFDRRGRHVATVNRLGHRTRFEHDAGGYLQRLLLPAPEGAPERAYRFVYDAATRKLARVEAPGAGATPRIMRLFGDGVRVDSIEDPDAFRVRFAYDTTSPTRITARKNKRGHATTFAYDSAGKVQGSFLAMDVGEDVRWTLRAQESQGFAAPARADGAHTWLDGPREGVSDTTRFWLGRWGEPDSILDALGHKTVLARTDLRFPALVTEVRHPNGFVERAAYTARGNLATQTQVAPYAPEDPADAVTTYAYGDPLWPDFVTRITLPQGEVTEVGYDAAGNRIWQQAGASPDTARRVRFSYNALGLAESVLSPANRATGARDSPHYDALGNLVTVVTRRGYAIIVGYDALGRMTERRLPEVLYPSRAEGIPSRAATGTPSCGAQGTYGEVNHRYPRYPNVPQGHAGDPCAGYLLAAELERFEYDALGNMTLAVNGNARVARSYYPGGALRTDSLHLRTVEGDTAGTPHRYGQRFEYDLDGRRTRAWHPTQLAPSTTGTGNFWVDYTYDGVTGALETVTDPLGYAFTRHYDLEGRVDSLTMRGSPLLPVARTERYAYDADGRLRVHEMSSRGDTLRYRQRAALDARGKLLAAGYEAGPRDSTWAVYSGLGYAVEHHMISRKPFGSTTATYRTDERFRYDPLGNIQEHISTTMEYVGNDAPYTNRTVNFNSYYQGGTARLG